MAMISSGPIEDRLSIRELVESHDDAVMQGDAQAWGDNWAEDATWSLPGMGEVTGRGAIVTTWYQQEFLHQKDGAKRAVTGRYQDEYVKLGGRWYFAKRVYVVLKSEPS